LYYEGNTPFPVGLGIGFDGFVNGSDQLVVLFERPAFLVSFQMSGNGVGVVASGAAAAAKEGDRDRTAASRRTNSRRAN
jgi:hypothetical protein